MYISIIVRIFQHLAKDGFVPLKYGMGLPFSNCKHCFTKYISGYLFLSILCIMYVDVFSGENWMFD